MYVTGVAVLVERCYDTLSGHYAVIPDLPYNELSGISWIGKVRKAGLPQVAAQRKESPGIHPLGKAVLRAVEIQFPVGYFGNQ